MLIGHIHVRQPFPWPVLLQYLSHRLVPELEEVTPTTFLRRVGKHTVTVSFDPQAAALRVTADGRVQTAEVLKCTSALFDVDHDGAPVAALLRASAVLRSRIDAAEGLRPLGAWSAFELCVRTVIGQQVSVAAARTLMRRLVQRCEELTPHSLANANLQQIGMPGKRVATIQTFALAVAEGRVTLEAPWQQLEAELKALPGFGPWTRGYLAIRLGRQADAFPETDLGLIRAANVATPAALSKLAEAWRPYRAYAATYLWAL